MVSTPRVQNVSVIGLGKLGLPLAACFASQGFNVVGVDLNKVTVTEVNNGHSSIAEPNLQELLSQHSSRLRATDDAVEAVLASDATFIIVPTPSVNGVFSLKFVLPAIEQVGRALSRKDAYHLVVITSTVMPQSMENVIRPALEKASGKECGLDFGLCYNPEFIALGNVVNDLLNPDFILIGANDERAAVALEGIYSRFSLNDAPVSRLNWVNAELCKIAVNTYITTKISFANMLAELCQNLPGASTDAVTSAMGMDARIGKRYLKGATAYGGPCFPRDTIAFAEMARTLGVTADIAEAAERINERQSARLADFIQLHAGQAKRIGILGMSYKPGTPVIECSAGIDLSRQLDERGFEIVIYDTLSGESAAQELGQSYCLAAAPERLIDSSDVIVIALPCPEWKAASLWSGRFEKSKTIIDCWRVLEPAQIGASFKYVAFGNGPALPLSHAPECTEYTPVRT